MNKQQFSTLLESIQSSERKEEGQKEYAHDDANVFANFDRVAKSLQLDRKQVLLVYALKHWDGIVSYVGGHKSQREDVRGRIKDLRMYLALLWGMIEEEERESVMRCAIDKAMDSCNEWDVGVAPTQIDQVEPGNLIEITHADGPDDRKFIPYVREGD